MIKRLIIFLILNFAALAIGGIFTGTGVSSDWYQNLNQAPWTPPGWVFGFAWTSIMICFSFYMAKAIEDPVYRKVILGLFTLQWILNVVWNPIFFYNHQVLLAAVVIVSLTILVAYLLITLKNELKWFSLLIAPYLLWLIIASSLNLYIYFNN